MSIFADGVIIQEVMEILKNNHQEADTKVVLHAKSPDREQGNIVIRVSDTDIAVLLLYHSANLSATLWMNTGTATKSIRRYINIKAIFHKLGLQMSSALPSFHSFSGCD